MVCCTKKKLQQKLQVHAMQDKVTVHSSHVYQGVELDRIASYVKGKSQKAVYRGWLLWQPQWRQMPVTASQHFTQ